MNLSPISYQPMSVSQKQQNATANFKAKEAILTKNVIQKLPEALAKTRSEAQAEIAKNRSKIAQLNEALKSDPKNASIIFDIKDLEVKTMTKIRDFNSKLNDFANTQYKHGNNNSRFAILADFYHYYLG